MTIVFLLLAAGAAGAGNALNESLVVILLWRLGAMLLALARRYG